MAHQRRTRLERILAAQTFGRRGAEQPQRQVNRRSPARDIVLNIGVDALIARVKFRRECQQQRIAGKHVETEQAPQAVERQIRAFPVSGGEFDFQRRTFLSQRRALLRKIRRRPCVLVRQNIGFCAGDVQPTVTIVGNRTVDPAGQRNLPRQQAMQPVQEERNIRRSASLRRVCWDGFREGCNGRHSDSPKTKRAICSLYCDTIRPFYRCSIIGCMTIVSPSMRSFSEPVHTGAGCLKEPDAAICVDLLPHNVSRIWSSSCDRCDLFSLR